ncbi:cytochrome P450 [Capillimicrobium parvum]|uniref:6-deoxyerythronolide B hydroxylase n=1 Tax=Capillimicrobium parvum TaxID=2884022 RepID=A0A9E7C197_9ACTN|nr:cytochrome P450 [Capillimicrobium parvum]UGS37260.1 6-deoxyerythronolide B hydroxylase [Capillimicrobium parvum]
MTDHAAAGTPALEGFDAWPPDEDTLRCPFRYFEEIRDQAPVYRYREPSPEGVVTYLVTGFEECASVLTRADVFVNDLSGVLPAFEANAVPSPRPGVPTFYEDRNVFFADGADHKVKRSWVLQLVERDRLESFRPMVEEVVDGLIDAFAADGRCDFRHQFTDPMALHVVRRIMGLPEQADPLIKRLSAVLSVADNNPAAPQELLDELRESWMGMLELCVELVERRHAEPVENDYVTDVVRLQVERDGALDPNALAKHLTVTIFGADHAMGGHLADMLARIGRDPQLQERLRADRSLIRQFMLEALRTESPVPWLFRQCVADATVGDVEIPAGSLVLVATIAGNHDPAEFPDPASFDVSRRNLERNQLTLGRGAHRCAGAQMARLQADVTVNKVLDRLRDIRLDEQRSDLRPEPSFGFRVPTAVHLTFTPEDSA